MKRKYKQGNKVYHDFIEDGAVNADHLRWCKRCQQWIPPPGIHTCLATPDAVKTTASAVKTAVRKIAERDTLCPSTQIKLPKHWSEMRKAKPNKRAVKPNKKEKR